MATEKERELEQNKRWQLANENYGTIQKSVDINGPVLSPEDLTRHLVAIGASGSGKSTLIRIIIKHLEEANLKGTFDSAVVYCDFKGGRDPDSMKLIKQLDPETLKTGKVHYLDPALTSFALNPLELPIYDPERREEVVERFTADFMTIIKEFYDQQQSYVQMERILKVILPYLYSKTDTPTFRDITALVQKISYAGKEILPEIYYALGKPENELKEAIESISTLKSEAFVPLLNRLELFSTNNFLKKIFTVKKSSINFSEILEPGHHTIAALNQTNLSSVSAPLAQMALVLKIWFTVIAESSNPKTKMKNVILVLDEFAIISGINAIPQILSQARSFGLGLMLATQNLSQLDKKLVEEIFGNTGTQLVGRVSGADAGTLGMLLDRKFQKEISEMTNVQPDFRWLIRARPPPGEETSLPTQFWLHYPPSETMTDEEYFKFISEQKAKHASVSEIEDNILKQSVQDSTKWMRQLSSPDAFVENADKWKILTILKDNTLNLSEIVDKVTSFDRDVTSFTVKQMLDNKLVKIVKTVKQGAVTIVLYSISNETRSKYFPDSFVSTENSIGEADGIDEVAQQAFNHHLEKFNFISIASQTVKSGKDRTDLLAYDYENEEAISVEVESESEVASHPEQVKYNMTKWRELGFKKCEVWSKSKKIQEIHEKLDPELQKDVEIHIVD